MIEVSLIFDLHLAFCKGIGLMYMFSSAKSVKHGQKKTSIYANDGAQFMV